MSLLGDDRISCSHVIKSNAAKCTVNWIERVEHADMVEKGLRSLSHLILWPGCREINVCKKVLCVLSPFNRDWTYDVHYN